MMAGLLNAIRAQASMAGNGRAAVRIGIVSSYDHANYCAKVRIQPEDTETGWLPVVSPWVGNGWGMFAPVTPGDVVEVQYQEDSFDAGFVCQRFFNDGIRPLDVQSGEFWLVHQSGSCLKFHNDGSVDLTSRTNLTATVGGNLAATVTGNATLTAANATVQATGTATIQAASIILKNAGAALRKICTDLFMTLYNNHTHTSSTAGTQTSTPTQQATVGTHTTNTVQAE